MLADLTRGVQNFLALEWEKRRFWGKTLSAISVPKTLSYAGDLNIQ